MSFFHGRDGRDGRDGKNGAKVSLCILFVLLRTPLVIRKLFKAGKRPKTTNMLKSIAQQSIFFGRVSTFIADQKSASDGVVLDKLRKNRILSGEN